jgi:AcrR family transcriptional regulator
MEAIATADAPAAGPGATELRIRRSALECIGRAGLSGTTVDDIARAAGVSRATTYRLFPGGRDTIIDAVVGQEVQRFFGGLAGELARHAEAEPLLVAGVGRALRFLAGHAALQAVLRREPDVLAAPIATHRLGPAIDAAVAFAAPYLRPHVPEGPDADRRATEVAELVVRLVLSYALQPGGTLDPDDDASVTRFVRTHLLPSLLADPPPTDPPSPEELP